MDATGRTPPLPPAAPPRVLVKVCGLTTPADAAMAADAGADWIGLNFHPPSPRFVDDGRAAAMLAALPSSSTPIGLYVDRTADGVAAHAARLGLEVVQLHGDEPPEDVAALKDAGLAVVRAFRIRDADAITRMDVYLDQCASLGAPPDAVLVDAYAPGLAGGTGRTIDPALLDRISRPPRLILAGGLRPENVAERVGAVWPWMVDVAGGVEIAPGIKDPALVAAFVRAATGAAPGRRRA